MYYNILILNLNFKKQNLYQKYLSNLKKKKKFMDCNSFKRKHNLIY